MASTTLNALVGPAKAGASAGSGLASALLPASGASFPGAAGTFGAGLSTTSTGTGPAAAPATIGDFLAMLSGMLQVTEATTAEAGAATAAIPGKPDVRKTELAPGTPEDVSQIYAQLLALMQDAPAGSAAQRAPDDAGAETPMAGLARTASSSAAAQTYIGNEIPSDTEQGDATPAAAAQIVSSAQMLASAGQGDLLAKLVGATSSQANADEGDQGESDPRSLAALVQADLKSLFADHSVSSYAQDNTTLKDLSALLAQPGETSASAPAARATQTPDPMLVQSAGPTITTAVANNSITPPASTAAAGGHLAAPVGTAAWTEQLGTHLAWMAGSDQQSASLKLTPPHLGPLEVQITVGDDNKASVYFSAPHADTRAALGEALPRLRELFGASGLTLTDANVSREPSRQKPRAQSADSAIAKASGVGPEGTAVTSGSRIAALHVGILDTYA